MICPDCNNDIMDGAKACPYCGTSFINKPKKKHSDILNRPISQMSIREQAAMKELKGISTFGMTVSLILTVVGFLGLFYGMCTKNKLSGIVVFISVIIIVIFGEYYFNSKNKMERMKSILDDKQRKAICFFEFVFLAISGFFIGLFSDIRFLCCSDFITFCSEYLSLNSGVHHSVEPPKPPSYILQTH
jgi:hypothetical protein